MPSRSSAIQAQKRAHANAADAKKTDTAERNLYVLENASVAKAHHHHGGHPHVPGEFDNALKSIYGTGGGSSAIHPGVGESKSDNTENAANPAVKTAKEKLMRASKLIMVQNRLRDKKVAEKEEKKKAAWADFVTYVLFMIFFSLNSIDGLGESSGFDFTNRLTSVLATSDWTNVNDVSGIHSYLQTKFVPALYSVNFDAVGSETGRGQPKDPSEWAAGWIVQGPVRIAQLRSDTYDCEREQSPVLQTYPFECTRNRILGFSSGSFNEEHEARKAYRGFTYNNPNVDKVAWQRSTAKYTTYQTPQYHNYPAPAFAVLVDPHGPRAEAEAAVKRLESDRYVDRQTNALMVDVTVYNYLLKMHVWVRYTAEFNSGGGVDAMVQVLPSKFFWAQDAFGYKITMQVFVALGYLNFFRNQAEKLWQIGWREVLKSDFMFYVQTINIAFYLIQLAFRYECSSVLEGGFLSTYVIGEGGGSGEIEMLGTRFVDFIGPTMALRTAMAFQAVNAFLNWFKLVTYLAEYPVYALMTKTLVAAVDELLAFFVVFAIIMFGFAQAHCMYFGNILSSYRTITDSFYTLFRAMLGDFNFTETYEVSYILGPFFFFMFVGIAFLVVLNIIIAIIADAYVEANEDRKTEIRKQRLLEEAQIADDLALGIKRDTSLVGRTLSIGKDVGELGIGTAVAGVSMGVGAVGAVGTVGLKGVSTVGSVGLGAVTAFGTAGQAGLGTVSGGLGTMTKRFSSAVPLDGSKMRRAFSSGASVGPAVSDAPDIENLSLNSQEGAVEL